MIPHVVSNIIEQIIRIILMIILIPKLVKNNIIITVCGVILINIISEIISFLVLFSFLPQKLILTKKDIIPNKEYIKTILNISIPNTLGRIIGSIFYFFEPIILMYFLQKSGYPKEYIIEEYGIIEGYVIPLITLPNFFSIAISNSLLPIISKYYSNNNYKAIKKKLYQSISISGLIGSITILILSIFPSFFLKLVYNTTLGKNYMLFLLPIFILYYIQPPLASILQGIDKSKDLLIHELIGTSSKILIIIITSYFKIGIYSLLFGIVTNITITTFFHIKTIKKYLTTLPL